MTINLLSRVGIDTAIAGLILTHTFFVLALFILRKLLTINLPAGRQGYEPRVINQTVLFLLLFPTSFFYVSIYSEGLFLLLTVLAFYLARKHQWFLAAITAMLLTATRLVGIAILPALIVEYIQQKKKLRSRQSLYFFLIPLGLMAYTLFNKIKYHNFFYFLTAQGELANGRSVAAIINPFQTLYRYLKIFTSVSPTVYEWWIALFEVTSFLFFTCLLWIAYKKRVRLSYLIFSLVALLIPDFSGTFSGLPRYGVVLFPLFLGLSLTKNKTMKILYVVISSILLFLLLVAFSRGYYVS